MLKKEQDHVASNTEKFTFPNEIIISLERPFEDERGQIIPLVDVPMKSCVLITSKKGTIRANHYHKTDWHFCYVIKGSVEYYHRPVGNTSPPERVIVKQGELFFTPPLVEHAMIFREDTVFLTLGGNSRKQESYESDLVRVDLISHDVAFK